ncbi:hypothetical protein AB0I94_32490 [Streptomyces sp. NPDC050147]|uniref:hypothetical protein n=1 Tax=Streptomyces sp. NPDC050147 TaxID=3155513 RepID=UPI003415694F
MTPSEAVEALGEAGLDVHLDRRNGSAADDGGRREAELAEWRRIMQLLAATGGPYDPDADTVVQEELAEDGRREEVEPQRRREQQRVAARADELAGLAGAGRLDRTAAIRPGDDAALIARRRPARRPGVPGSRRRDQCDAESSGVPFRSDVSG